jgi:protoporphyrinogen oxidase
VTGILILGAGPTGLGAAHGLASLGRDDYMVLERETKPGGLAASFTDACGYTWDVGGHVLFSHYDAFDAAAAALSDDEWLRHTRAAWILREGAWVPYPFQSNLHRLPPALRADCLAGLVEAALRPHAHEPRDFGEYLQRTFGAGIAAAFMIPYNEKVWAYPLSSMDWRWTGERVAVPDPVRAVRNAVLEEDDAGWGPNSAFRFPRHGGTGALWRALAALLPQEKIAYCADVLEVDLERHCVHLRDGSTVEYGALISTAPLDWMVAACDLDELRGEAAQLVHTAVNVVGVGVLGHPPAALRDTCWIYSPDRDVPFYRVTHFSHYSPFNVPQGEPRWSLMAEVAEPPSGATHEVTDEVALAGRTVDALRRLGLLGDAERIETLWTHRVEYGYPTPTLGRNAALERILPVLARSDVHCRGRFGGWKYEVGNMDHSFMQGYELARWLVTGEEEQTFPHPERVNAPR